MFLVLVGGCAIKEGPYSSQVGSVTTDFVKNYTEFFENIQVEGGTKASDYQKNAPSYGKMYADLSQLDLYSNHPVNNGIEEQVVDLRSKLDSIGDHERQSGISPALAKNEIGQLNEDVGRIIELEKSAQNVAGTTKSAGTSTN